jgi:hypothetical protein
MSYASEEVEAGRADWVDKADPTQGILCRAVLYSGELLITAAPESLSKFARPRRCPLPSIEVPLTRFDDPIKNQATRRERQQLVLSARAVAFFGTAFPDSLVQQL